MDPFISLLEVHKLMYFAQEAGEPLRLNYKKALYGPYAENLRHVLAKIEGHLVAGYADGGDAPDKQLKLVPGAVEDATNCLRQNPRTQARFARVTALVDGFESPFGMELLATVHWVMSHERTHDDAAIVSAVHGWNARKQAFTPRQIRLAAERLRAQGWVDSQVATAG